MPGSPKPKKSFLGYPNPCLIDLKCPANPPWINLEGMKRYFNIIKLLRFPISFILLPVTLFSFIFIPGNDVWRETAVALIWHLLVFPSSNGYNSYNDRDEGPIGALANPPRPTRQLLNVVNMLDGLALVLSAWMGTWFLVFVAGYILASRLYSFRGIRLKKFPVTGFLIVFIFQGAWVFCGNVLALSYYEIFLDPAVYLAAIASSLMVGTVYPVTQIYQHDADRKDGVNTLSMLLGYKGTFIFSALMFMGALICMYLSFHFKNAAENFWLFMLVMAPGAAYFVYWAIRSFSDSAHVNFRNTMTLLLLSSACNNLCFSLLLYGFHP